MQNIYFSNLSNALKYIRKNSEEIYDGVYKMNNGTLIKKYIKEKSIERFDDFSEENILAFKDIYIEGIAFTRALVYSNLHNIYATITEYVPGESIESKLLGDYPIGDLLLAIKKLEITIKKISELGICATDIYRGNIVYDGKNITLIDTIEYHYSKDNISIIFEDNMLGIMNEIFTSIFYKDGLDSVKRVHKYFSLHGSNFECFNSRENLMNPCETLIKIKKFIEEDFGIKLNTFNECHSFIEEVILKEKNKSKILSLFK